MGDDALEALNELDIPLGAPAGTAARRDPAADAVDRRAVRAEHRRVARRASAPSASSGRRSACSATGTRSCRRTEVGSTLRSCAAGELIFQVARRLTPAAPSRPSAARSCRACRRRRSARRRRRASRQRERLRRSARVSAPAANSGSTLRSIAPRGQRLLLERAARSVEPWMRRALAHQRAQVELGAARRRRSRSSTIRPPSASAVEVVGEVGRADQLEDHVERAVLGEALGLDHGRAERGDRRRGAPRCARSR